MAKGGGEGGVNQKSRKSQINFRPSDSNELSWRWEEMGGVGNREAEGNGDALNERQRDAADVKERDKASKRASERERERQTNRRFVQYDNVNESAAFVSTEQPRVT